MPNPRTPVAIKTNQKSLCDFVVTTAAGLVDTTTVITPAQVASDAPGIATAALDPENNRAIWISPVGLSGGATRITVTCPGAQFLGEWDVTVTAIPSQAGVTPGTVHAPVPK